MGRGETMGPALFLPVAVAAFMMLLLWAAVTGLTERLRRLVDAVRRATPNQRVWAVAILLGFFFSLYVIGQAKRNAQLDILREQFNVPKSATVTGLRIAKYSSTSRPRVEAVVQFTQQEFDAYVAALEKPGVLRLAFRTFVKRHCF